jgi:CheY-like chemotaxis protein/anti-sigma regulatory factor (Ser/Thr protein kinase)
LEAQAKGLVFHYQEEGALPAVVRADEKRVRQILINLLGNAIKFTTQGQVSLRIRYAREMALIAIEDSGPGLSSEQQARIFEPFTRASTTGVATPGAGLGLTIAKMLTDLMGGELSVSSTPGVGSVFKLKLFLPEVHVASGTAGRRSAAGAVPRLAYAGARRRVLVVDNEETDRELLVNLLQPLGFELRTAASGHDCLDLLASGYHPDVILMDLAMPGIDGWETIRRLRKIEAETLQAAAQIAIVSANAFDQALENDVGIPAQDFILKPLRHSELLDWLERHLDLVWLSAAVVAVAVTAPANTAAPVYPGRAQLDALREVVTLGYYRGILNQLDAIEAAQPASAPFVANMRGLARQFQFETMGQELSKLE